MKYMYIHICVYMYMCVCADTGAVHRQVCLKVRMGHKREVYGVM